MELKKPKFISFKEILPRLYETVPGLIKGKYYAVSGATSTGKTKFAKFLFVTHAYNYCKKHDIPLKILYFALEESVENFWISIQCDLLYAKYGELSTFYQIEGYHEGVTQEIMTHYHEFDAEIEEMKKCIIVLDHVYNPTGCLMEVKKIMKTLGTTEEIGEIDEAGNKFKSLNFKYFNDDTNVIIVLDHKSF